MTELHHPAGEPKFGEWLDISSAPKDGAFVLVCQPSGYITCAQFCGDQFWRGHIDQQSWQAFTPRWWMPLPDPPKGDA